ncbi:MAG: lauroyl acyltransferase [Alphaproteobacteria bacterium]|nr:lauroyl acyltransferase [Alphaproteobacteria bacterium]MBT5389508.1 lauroyl acyltransferase [Alphaproteobacteria bacterium]
MKQLLKIKTYLGYFLAAIPAYLLYGFFWALPLAWSSAVGGKLARFVGPKLPVTNRAYSNLRKAFPKKSQQELARIVPNMWENLGRFCGEFPHLPRILSNPKYTTVTGTEYIELLMNDGKPGIFFSGHVGNWELGALSIMRYGFPLHVVYRSANNPLIDWLIRFSRTKASNLTFVPKGPEGAKKLLKALKQGQHLGLLLDQKMNDGISVPFFGKEAMTAPAAAQFALKYDTPLVPIFVERLQGPKFHIVIYPPLEIKKTGNQEQDVLRIMEQVNETLEQWIRKHPGQWLWLHNRWK